MNKRGRRFTGCFYSFAALALAAFTLQAETIRIATYNVENYLGHPTATRSHPKSAQSRAAIRACVRALNPDVLAIQEMGGVPELLELKDSLKSDGLDLPHWELVSGFDTNIHVAVLSKFPFTGRRPHTNDSFLLNGRRLRVSRGFAEVDIKVSPAYSFTLIVAHLKSKRPVPEADQSEERFEEARVLRDLIDADLAANPQMNLAVAGDFNDTKDSAPLKHVIGRGRFKLVDTRPAERNGATGDPSDGRRTVTWTDYYGKEDSYSRIDYILLSPGMAREWLPGETFVLAAPDWGIASDHRPIVAGFEAAEK
jgi:endonuclease/exonuclease/phosphatase family metal-dependent hydrolase